ncbi:MAG: Holliday junction resolvase RuvX [Legionellales bacterium]|nr:MAG: Holliday junction resolvase RuvX [Legionellales bacterium]
MTQSVLAFDFGMKYIGVAVGSSVTNTATPLSSIHARDGIPAWQEITTLLERWQPCDLIVGLPLRMDGTEQLMTKCALKFAARLRGRYLLPVHMIDETLTTWQAKNQIADNRKLDAINANAAAIILTDWLQIYPC